MSSSAARSADRGGAAGGGVWKESTLQLFQPCRKAALRLTVNPFGSDEPLPLYHAVARHRGRHSPAAACGLELRTEVDIAVFQTFIYGTQLH